MGWLQTGEGQNAEDKEREGGEKKTERIVRSIVKEWKWNLRSKIEKEIREEVEIKYDRLSEVIEEERKEVKTYIEEMKKIKELIKHKMENLRKT